MKDPIENYKGIEFIRISALPDEEKKMLFRSMNTQKIINILREEELLNNCVLYNDYKEWSQNNLQAIGDPKAN